MKLRKHKGNRTYKITWAQRTAKRVETHVGRGGKTERVATGGDLKEQPEIVTEGQNPTAVLNAFLFGRDRANIVAEVWLREPSFPTLSKSGNVWIGVKYYSCGRTV